MSHPGHDEARANPDPAGAGSAVEDRISIQEAWEAAGGNPGIKPGREELLEALRLLDQVCDEADAHEEPRLDFRNGEFQGGVMIRRENHHAGEDAGAGGAADPVDPVDPVEPMRAFYEKQAESLGWSDRSEGCVEFLTRRAYETGHQDALDQRAAHGPHEAGEGASPRGVALPGYLVRFLLGEGALEGFWFGDRPATEGGDALWWRSRLRRALGRPEAAAPANPSASGPVR